jgi:branched-chain amino acid transport system ATP-binding protein
MNSRQVAEMGMARTFQNLALFKGMSVIDNIMTGRNLRIKSNLFLQALRIGPAQREEESTANSSSTSSTSWKSRPTARRRCGQLPYGLQKRVDLGRALAMEPQVLLLDEPMAGMNLEEKQDMSRFRPGRQRRVRHHRGADRARHGRGDGHLRPRRGAGLRQEDRRRHPDEVRNNEEVISAYLGTSH